MVDPLQIPTAIYRGTRCAPSVPTHNQPTERRGDALGPEYDTWRA